jgi:hypothetical protein
MALHLSLVGFDHQREAFGNTDGRCNFERRPGLGKIAYGAVNGAAPEGNLARLQEPATWCLSVLVQRQEPPR